MQAVFILRMLEVVVVACAVAARVFGPGIRCRLPTVLESLLGFLWLTAGRRCSSGKLGITGGIAVVGIFHPVQQRVAGHRLGHFGFQLRGGQLQQMNGLTQLRRQYQLLLRGGG